MLNKFIENKSDYFYLIFRIIIGLLFLLHGVTKLQGIIDGKIIIISLIGLAAAIELLSGIMIIVGLFTRYFAILSAVTMLVAYFKVHFPQGLNPLMNNGELALLFFAAFLVIIAFGSGKWSLDNILKI